MEVPLSFADCSNYHVKPITTLYLYSGWDASTTSELRSAAAALLEKNPALSGKLIPPLQGKAAHVKAGAYQDPVLVLPEKAGYALPASLPERLRDLFNVLEPYIHSAAGSLSDGLGQFVEGSRLFQIVVLPLGHGLACLRVQISHILVDGAAYYRVMAALHAELTGNEKPVAILWGQTGEPPAIPEPPRPVRPEWQNKMQRACFRWKNRMLPFLERRGLKAPRVGNIALTDAAALDACKAAAGAHAAAGFVSKNDVMLAACSEVIGLGCVGHLWVNLRGRGLPNSHVSSEHAGNCIRCVHFPCREAGHCVTGPAYVRDVLLRNLVCYEKQPVPEWPLLTDQKGCVNSWTGVTEFFVPKGTAVLAHCPGRVHIDTKKNDHAILFTPQPGASPAILHNYLINSWGFRARVRASSWWRKVVSAEAVWPPSPAESSSRASLLDCSCWSRSVAAFIIVTLPIIAKWHRSKKLSA